MSKGMRFVFKLDFGLTLKVKRSIIEAWFTTYCRDRDTDILVGG